MEKETPENLLRQLRAMQPKVAEEERQKQAERAALELRLTAACAELERKTTALSVAERRLRVLLRATAQIVWISDSTGRIVEAEGWTEFTGQSFEDMQAGRYGEVLHPDEAEDVLAAWKTSVQFGMPYVIEHRLRRRDGVYEMFSVRGVPLLDESGKIVEWIGMTTNLQFRQGRPIESVTVRGREVAGVIVPGLSPHPPRPAPAPGVGVVEAGIGVVEVGFSAAEGGAA